MAGPLVDVQARLSEWDGQDRDALIPIGVELEAYLGDVPDGHERAEALLTLALEALQALYVGDVASFSDVREAISAAIVAVGQSVESSDGEAASVLCTAGRALSAALGRDGADWDEAGEVADAPPPYATPQTLDDAAALLMQLEPGDAAGLEALRAGLSAIAAGADSGVRASLEAAIVATAPLALGSASDPDAVFAEVGRLIEAAMLAEEDAGMTAPPPPVHAEQEPEAASDEILPKDADRSLLGEFITECRELIDGAEAALLAIETDPDDAEAINTVFRAFHTIKGTSAFLGLTSLSELAHRAENLLSRIRDKEIRCTGGYADLALRSVDMLAELIQAVQDALEDESAEMPAGLTDLMEVLANPEASIAVNESTIEQTPRLGDTLVAEGAAAREVVEEVASHKGDEPLGMEMVRSGAVKLTDVATTLRQQQRMKTSDRADDSSVRVRTDRLDRLIEMVGELVIAQSMVAQDPTVVVGGHLELTRKVAHAGKIVRELQDLSMSMRMVPLKATFQKMARLVRDLAHKSGKLVEFSTEGDDTEIDRNMVDIIADPLVHMVRNAADHGVEAPDLREAAGKPRAGSIHLSAFHSGGNVVVQIQDDGKGLNREAIVRKALEKGLIDSDKGMSDAEVYDLIFAPGFSTVDKVTEVSGRGVGMDVVRKSVEALRGHVEIASEPGKGTTFSLRLPLTLAITDGMLVKIGEDRYIIPTVNIHLSFRPEPDSLSTVAGRGELVMLRGELMPVFRLHRLFNVAGAVQDPTQGLLVVIGNEGRRCALLVDELLGQQQVVAKTLGNGMGKVQGVSGGAILGDGRVGLILDTTEIVALARTSRSGAAA